MISIKKVHETFVSNWIAFVASVCVVLAFRFWSDWSNFTLWGNTLVQIGIAFFLLQLDHIFTIIRRRTLLPMLFYIILVGCNPIFDFSLRSSLAALLMMVNYLFLFQTYQKPDSQLNALNISLILVLGSLFWPQYLLFFPIFWVGFYRFHSFNFRVFLASLIGIFVVYLFVFAWGIYQNDWQMFFSFLPKPEEIFSISKPNISDYEWISLGVILFTYIFAGFNLFIVSISENIKTISFLKYLYVSSFFIYAMSFVQSEYRSYWESIAYISIALVLAHYFTLTNKLYVKILMLIFLLTLLIVRFLQYFST